MTIQSILNAKGTAVETITPDVPLSTVIDRLHARRVGALVVSEDGKAVSGIISERDIIGALCRNGAAALDQPVQKVMTAQVVTASRDDSVGEAMAIMTERRIRHLPVVEDGVLCGIISIGDVVKVRIDQAETEAHALRDYIAGGG